MRILHLNTERTWRGGEQQMCYLALGLQERGHEAHVLCRPGSPCMDKARAMGLNVRGLRVRSDIGILAGRRVARLADELKADIVHAHTSKTHLAAVFAKRFSRCKPRCVVHRRVDFSIHKLPLRLSGLKYRGGVDRYIAITSAVKAVMVGDGIPGDRISVIHSSTDLNRFEGITRKPGLQSALGIPAAARVVGNVAALVGHKDHMNLIGAAAIVLKDFPDAFFVILGEGPLRAELESYARSLGIQDRVILPGFRGDVPQCMVEFEVFCMSSWGEGMGSAVLEAMAMRLPVVATRAGGLVEVIRDGVNGLLVPPRDSQALAGAICRTLADPRMARRLALAGRETVEREFSTDKMVEETLAVYEEIV